MKFQIKARKHTNNEEVVIVLEAADAQQAMRYVKAAYKNLYKVSLGIVNADVPSDVEFTTVQHFLSAKQYLKMRKDRGDVAIPVMFVKSKI